MEEDIEQYRKAVEKLERLPSNAPTTIDLNPAQVERLDAIMRDKGYGGADDFFQFLRKPYTELAPLMQSRHDDGRNR